LSSCWGDGDGKISLFDSLRDYPSAKISSLFKSSYDTSRTLSLHLILFTYIFNI